MTPIQLRQWSMKNNQPDQWWLCLDGVTEEIPVTAAEIERLVKTGDYALAQVLPATQAEMANSVWFDVTMPAALTPIPTITTASAALSTLEASGTPGMTRVGGSTKGQNFGCAALVIFGLGFLFVLYGNHRDETERKAREALAQEQRDARETEANLKYNRQHAQSQHEAGQEVRHTNRSQRVAESASDFWYAGGTLTGAKMAEWNRSTYANRLATSADFAARALNSQGKDLPSMDEFKPMAIRLERAISESNRDGVADKMSASEIAAACWLLMDR